jgi:hypothetical protein
MQRKALAIQERARIRELEKDAERDVSMDDLENLIFMHKVQGGRTTGRRGSVRSANTVSR